MAAPSQAPTAIEESSSSSLAPRHGVIIYVHEDGLTVDVQYHHPGPSDAPVDDSEDIIEHHIPLHRLQIYIPPPVIIVLPPPPSDNEIISNILNMMVAKIAGEDPIAPLVDNNDALITSHLVTTANTIPSIPPKPTTSSSSNQKDLSKTTTTTTNNNADTMGSPSIHSPKGRKKKVALLVPHQSPSFPPDDGVSALEDGEGVSGTYSVMDISGLPSIAESTADLITPIKKTNSSLLNSPMRRRSPSPSYKFRYASERPVAIGDRVEARQNVLRLGNLSRWYWGKVVFCRINGEYCVNDIPSWYIYLTLFSHPMLFQSV